MVVWVEHHYIPALLKYGKNHPDEEWYVMIPGWDFMLWGIEELQERTFNPETKGMFQNYYWDADRVIAPEPYKLPAFYRNEISLAEAFDELINGTTDHSDLPDMTLELTVDELLSGRSFINNAIQHLNGGGSVGGGCGSCEPPKPVENHKKVVVYQPFGSTAYHSEMGIYDKSMRSISHIFANEIAKALAKDYIVINMNGPLTGFEGVVNFSQDPDLRTWAAIIQEADYFIGCDSCGQHIAQVGTPASVMVAGTHEVNVSYPGKFHIIKNDAKYYPNPMRVSMMNSTLADKLNQKRGVFTEEEQKSHIKEIIRRIEGGKKVTEAVTVKAKKVKDDKGFA